MVILGLSEWKPDAAKIHANHPKMPPTPRIDVTAPIRMSKPAVWKLSTPDFSLSLLNARMKNMETTIWRTTAPRIMAKNEKANGGSPPDDAREESKATTTNAINVATPTTMMIKP